MTKAELLNKETYDFDDLCAIVDILRAPDGCPWDRIQTHESLRNNFIEEAYEVVDGIDRKDNDALREELGDVLLEVLFHVGLAREEGAFDLSDVLSGICRKMIRRHPHVFGNETLAEDQIQASWDEIKRREKGAKSKEDTLNGIAGSLPALMRAEKVAEKSGFAVLREEAMPQEDPVLAGGEALYRVCLDLVRQEICPEEALQRYLTRLIRDPESYR
ncbi:MAG: MazG family protein [Clostridia bacterium]|nr:MazG family protein [Clostridia bacterium]